MIIGKNMFAMLLIEKFFKTFTKKEISDTTKNTEVLIALSTKNRETVDQMMNKAAGNLERKRIMVRCIYLALNILMDIPGKYFT